MVDEYYIMYDITENDIRENISKLCKEYGLSRIQKSIFTGSLSKTKLKELKVLFEEEIKEATAFILIQFVCSSCYNKSNELMSINYENSIEEDFSEKKPVVLIF
jgi:CRISPR-associated protein Cas2